jgi:hypothetical protein
MKTMTCKQLGGPCNEQFHGSTADDVIKAQDQHLKERVAMGDKAHKEALDAMEARWMNPTGGMDWYNKAKSDFEALPEDK